MRAVSFVPGLLVASGLALWACGGGGEQYTADQVLAAFRAAGLSAEDPQPVQPSAAPQVHADGRAFTIASIAPRGGQVLTFDSQKDLQTMRDWFGRFPDLAPYVYAKGNVLVQLNAGLPKAEAERYRAALEGLD